MRTTISLSLILAALVAFPSGARGQGGTNPVPTINSLGGPSCAPAGGPAFDLSVYGLNFVTSSVVRWNGSDRPTTFYASSYVTAQISASDIAAAGTAAVTVFNPAPGGGSSNSLTFTITTGGVEDPQSIAVDPTGKYAYVANSGCPADSFAGQVSMYTINATTGALASIGPPLATNDEGAHSVTVDPSGQFAYVVNWGEGDTAGSLSSYTINATTGALTSTGTITGSCGFADSLCSPWSVVVDPSGKFAYVANEGGPAPTNVSMYAIDATTGALTSIGTVAAGGRAISVAVDPKGKSAYVATDSDLPGLAGNVSMYTINAATGALSPIGTIIAGTNPASVTVDPTGKFAYVANSGSNDVSMYTINVTTGALTSIGLMGAGSGPAAAAVDPAGRFAYVANSGSNDVWMYTINATTGALTSMGTIAAGSNPTSVAIHPSGEFAYVTNSGSSDISMYRIDAASGILTPIGAMGPPTLTSVSPNSGTQGNNVPVTLSGTNFTSGAAINFGGAGVTVSNTAVVNSTTITATFAIATNAATGAQSVSVTTTGGTSGNVSFTVNAAPPSAPTLTSISPNSGTQGNNNLPVTLTGTNFIAGAAINFGGAGVTVSNIAVVNSTTITAAFTIAANAATGLQNVSVTTTGGTSGNASFTVLAAPPPAPTLTSISPNSGTQGNNILPVTLTGTNFISGATINFGGAGVTISNTTVVNSATITATLAIAASAATGGRSVSVTTAGGTSNGVTFTVNAASPSAPTLTSISPSSGTQGNSNLPVTLTGANFIAGAAINFGGAGVAISNTAVVNSTTITASFAIAANAATGPQNVSVTTAGGTSTIVTFTVNPNGPLASFSVPSLAFPPQFVGTTSANATAVFSNVGNAALNYASIAMGGTNSSDFAFASGPAACSLSGGSLAGGTSCNLTVVFTPSATGNRSAVISVADNAAGNPHSLMLSGVGAAAFSLAPATGQPTTETISAGAAAVFSVAVSVASGANGTISLACSGAPPAGSCQVVPSSIQGNTPNTVVRVSVTTTARSLLPPTVHSLRLEAPTAPGTIPVGLLFILLFLVFVRHRPAPLPASSAALPVFPASARRRRQLALASLLTACAMAAACGGSASSVGGQVGTPAGTYPVTVTGTAGSSAQSLQLDVTVR